MIIIYINNRAPKVQGSMCRIELHLSSGTEGVNKNKHIMKMNSRLRHIPAATSFLYFPEPIAPAPTHERHSLQLLKAKGE